MSRVLEGVSPGGGAGAQWEDEAEATWRGRSSPVGRTV